MEDEIEGNDQGYLNEDEIMGDGEQDDEEENQVIDENDSNSDRRFPVPEEIGWIQWFCSFKKHQFFVEIDEEFLKKKSNLVGIDCKDFVNKMLNSNEDFLDIDEDKLSDDEFDDRIGPIKTIYGLLHKRFINTPKGMALMREKYLNEVYGHCPRILCDKQFLLPVGLSEELKFSKVKVYCPICEEVYKPRGKGGSMDGAFFGNSYPQNFLMHYPDLNPKLKIYKHYIPKLYGFKIFGKKGSKYYSKDEDELEEKMKKLNIKLDY